MRRLTVGVVFTAAIMMAATGCTHASTSSRPIGCPRPYLATGSPNSDLPLSCARLVNARTIRYTWVGIGNCPAVQSVRTVNAHRVELRFADMFNHCMDGPGGATAMLLRVPRPVAAPVVIDVRYDGHPKATYTAAVAAG